MMARIAFLSDSDSQWLEDIIRALTGEQVISNPPLLKEALIETEAIIVDCLDAVEIAGKIEEVKILRCRVGFRGTIILLSFLPPRRLVTGPREKALCGPGCRILQAPFLISDFAPLLSHKFELQSEELEKVCRTVNLIDSNHALSRLAHDYANKFSLCLIHLRQIERLSCRPGPNCDIVLDEILKVRGSLTLEKVNGFHTEFTSLLGHLHTIASTEQLQPPALLSEQLCKEAADWLRLTDPSCGVCEGNLEVIFQQCRKMQASISNLKTIIADLKITFDAKVQDDQ
jgi:hypothetical protein